MPEHKQSNSNAEVDGGKVAGYASTFDREPDSYGDVIAIGAFAESVKEWEAKMDEGIYLPLLYGHSTEDPEYNIGRVTALKEDERGLFIEAEFDPDNDKAQYVRKLVNEGRLYQFSFAFDCTDWADVKLEDGTEARELRKLTLYEVSLVQIPANQHAVVTASKSAPEGGKAEQGALERIAACLADIREEADEIQTIVNGFAAEDEQPEANGEEEQPNPDEPKSLGAEAASLVARANQIIEKGTR